MTHYMKRSIHHFIINKCLAPFNDTIMLVNEMNINNHLDNKLQYDFLLNSLRRETDLQLG